MLPTTAPELPPDPRLTGTRIALLSVATAVLLFLLVPVSVVAGVGG